MEATQAGDERVTVTGWKLDEADRAKLLVQFPPHWPDVVADHITLDAEAGETDPLPPAHRAEIVGEANDNEGLQALVVAIGGDTGRPDGGTYHITWSLDRARGRQPSQSNEVIACGWSTLDASVPIQVYPARWD